MAPVAKATAPVAIGDDMKRLAVDTIANKYASYGVGITGTCADASAIQTALTKEAKKKIPNIGRNVQYYDLQLQTCLGSVWADKNDERVTILFPYPSGTGKSTTFAVVHMTDSGVLESPAVTNGEYGVSVTVDSTSPFAIAWRKSGGNSSGSDSSENANYEFWKTVTENIRRADDGGLVKVDAKSYDRMPWTVMQALRDNDVTLVIDWTGGSTITIPAGQALADEAGRSYYPLSYLEQKYKNSSVSAGQTEVNPTTGRTVEVVAPAVADIKGAIVTPATQGVDEAQAEQEIPVIEVPAIANPSVQQPDVAVRNTGIFVAVVAAAVALAAGTFLLWRKKHEEL